MIRTQVRLRWFSTTTTSDSLAAPSLSALSARARAELQCSQHPAFDWCLTSARASSPLLDTLIVGGGQAGVATLLGLQRDAVLRTVAVDRAARDAEGPWRTYARMPHLRTPKQLNGLDFGVAALSFRAYYETLFGAVQYAALDKIPTAMWADYLMFLRDTVPLNDRVLNDTNVESIRWNGAAFDVELRATTAGAAAAAAAAAKPRSVQARTIVLARGRAANWFMPDSLRAAVPADRLFHTSSAAINALPFEGKSFLVVGIGASGLDHAEFAAERGATVYALARRQQEMAIRPNFFVWTASNVGLLKHFPDMSDADKFRLQFEWQVDGEPAPVDTYERALSKGAQFVSGEIASVARNGAGAKTALTVTLKDGRRLDVDYVIAATGNASLGDGLSGDPALAHIAPRIKLWRDVHEPTLTAAQAARESPMKVSEARVAAMRESLLAQPYLGGDFSLTPRAPSDEWVRNVFVFDYASAASHGVSGLGVTGLKYGIPRLVDGVTRRLFLGEFGELRKSWHTFRTTGNITFAPVATTTAAAAVAAAATSSSESAYMAQLNAMSEAAFLAELRPIFNTPLLDFALQSAARARPLRSSEALMRVLSDAVHQTTSAAQKSAILAAHDRLAITPVKELGADALREQKSTGLLALDAQRQRRFLTLNEAYEAKFGHPFVMAVSGKPIDEILEQMERRLGNTVETELTNGTVQLLRVAELRLERKIAGVSTQR
jgi:OHCU decarboxylase